MNNTRLFLAGIPTEPDVDQLRRSFGVPQAGTVISYEDMARALGYSKESKGSRFRTVLNAWRKALYREHRVQFKAEPRVGLRALSEDGKTVTNNRDWKNKLRGAFRAGARQSAVDRTRLSPENARIHDHVVKVTSAVRLAAATAPRQLSA